MEVEPDPQAVIEAQLAACREAEEREVHLQACQEAEAQHQLAKEKDNGENNETKNQVDKEIALEICNIVELVVIKARKDQVVVDPKKLEQPTPGLMMVASVAANQQEYDPAKAFDLGRDTQLPPREIPVELYNLDDFLEEQENLVTPAVPVPIVVPNRISANHSHINNDLKERCVIWALSDKKEIRYYTIFRVRGDWHYEVVRKQFRSMRNGKEIDLSVVIAMSLSSMFRRYNDDYIDHGTRRPHSITSLINDDHLKLVDKEKIITHRYVSFKNLELYDYGTFVMKWMEVIEPTEIDATKPYPINAWSTEELHKFRKEIIWQIILSKESLYVQNAID
ncbi:hypothetical protein PIB30_096496 [Stylosanthes scabra]|uniref:Uncharacterized protein n=1 Tax=Stylosanthes scabra TaxID=79078 RepID=A0ABU6XWR2_9FABA|nr:hypothetical protein [Stylosanthes scabra]